MAKLTFAQNYNRGTSSLLGRFDPEDVIVADASTFKLKIPNDYDDPPEIQNWTVTYKAAGSSSFKYSPGEGGVQEAVSGKLGSLEVHDENGVLVMTISKIAGVDIGDIYAYIVNRPDSPNSDPERVMEFIMRGNDKLIGTSDDDQLGIHYNAGNDVFKGKGGGDYIEAGAGDDTIDGGGDFDTLTYKGTLWQSTARQGAVIDLDAGEAIDPWGDTDTFKNIERFEGSHLADTFKHSGDDPVEFFAIEGSKGADSFKLDKASNVYVSYSNDHWDGGHRGIVADLGGIKNKGKEIKGTITDGWGHTDKTFNVRKVEGTDNDDVFKGSRLADHFNGRDGTDQYDGGNGVDWLHFDNGGGGSINVNLALGAGQIIDDSHGNTESAVSIEGIVGSGDNDIIIGGAGKNELLGAGGNDTLTGGASADNFIYGHFHGNGFGDTLTDFVSGTDKLLFDSSYIEGLDDKVRFVNGTEATSKGGQSQFFFNAADHTLYLDINGKTAGGVMMVAVLEGVASLSKSDIKIVENYIDIV